MPLLLVTLAGWLVFMAGWIALHAWLAGRVHFDDDPASSPLEEATP